MQTTLASKEMILADSYTTCTELQKVVSITTGLDATKVQVDKPNLSSLQQVTFSNYKSTNTYKVLIGTSPSGIITFVSKLYARSIILDKELTQCT